MKNDQSSENYLDQLLTTVNSNVVEDNRPRKKKKPPTEAEAFEKELLGEMDDTDEMMTARDEDDFLREFEAELLKDDIPNFEESFFDEAEAVETDGQGDMEDMDASIDAMLSHMDAFDGNLIQAGMGEEPPVVDENAEFDGTVEGEPLFFTEEAVDSEGPDPETKEPDVSPSEAGAEPALPEAGADLALTEDGEADLSGMGGSDLMDLLSGADGMSDLGDMLTADSEGIGLSGEDEIGNFAQGEMEAQERSASPEEEEEGGGKRKRKKKKKQKEEKAQDQEQGEKKAGGFFSKLAKLFFGEEAPKEDAFSMQDMGSESMASQLSQENLQILKELEGTDGAAADTGKKKKKEKKKDKEKAKAAKPKKEPKPKKPPKPKKEKKPKEKDNTPPLPKGPVRAIVVMVASLFGLVMLGANLLGYQASVNEAKSLAAEGSYADAYAKLAGVEIKEKDMLFYNQMAVLAPTSSEYNTYLIFSSSGRERMALDALICAYGRYNLNKSNAREYECMAELEILGSKVLKSLLEDYNMTGQEALELYRMRTRKQYTLLLYEKCESLGLE